MAKMILKDVKTIVLELEEDGNVLLGLMIDDLFVSQFVGMVWLFQ